ncbi:MAG: choice-of-anchor L domain-containing protein [Saprospiraceae bacterium]
MLTLRVTIFSLLLVTSLYGQFEVHESTTQLLSPENLIYNYFQGSGVTVLKVKYEGPAMSVGYFDKGKNVFGIEKGLVMTTGRVTTTNKGTSIQYGIDAMGKDQADNNNGSNVYDPDATLISKETPQNLVKYSISFRPDSDTLQFRYVFASEEYPEYSCREYNDLFGFFISGPGIEGPFQNKGINIALVPNSEKYVNINNIHPEFKTGNCPPSYSEYYHDNVDKQPVFDGFLDVFTATVPVIPCETYNIKLLIADVGDKRMDSAVFLEAKSFGAKAIKAQVIKDIATEACSNAQVDFYITKQTNVDTKIPIRIVGGSANVGQDFEPLAAELLIKKGETKATLTVRAVADQTKEGIETIGLEYESSTCKRDTIWLFVQDNIIKSLDLGAAKTFCKGANIELQANLELDTDKCKFFKNSKNYAIETIDPSGQAIPTISEINVSGVIPYQLRSSSIDSVCVNISHERSGDLSLHLIAPNGRFLELSSENGLNGQNYRNTCFSPKAKKVIKNADAPFDGVFEPEGSWDDLIGQGKNEINGIWKLQIVDKHSGNQGVLEHWSIAFKPPYELLYNWSPQSLVACPKCQHTTYISDQPGFVTLQVSDDFGCVAKDTLNFGFANVSPAPVVSCQKVTANSITFQWKDTLNTSATFRIRANQGNWMNPSSATSHTFDNLPLNKEIKLEVKTVDFSQCPISFFESGSATCSTPDCEPPTIEVKNIVQESCAGKQDARIELLSNTSPATFSVEKLVNTTGVFTQLSAGNYRFKVQNDKGCAAYLEIEIKPVSKIAVNATVQHVRCTGAKDAAIQIQCTQGKAPYQYRWSNGQRDSLIKGLTTGLYKLSIVDSKGCSTWEQYEIRALSEIKITENIVPVSCLGTASGAIQLNCNGGISPYRYRWSNNQIRPDLQKLNAGKYTVVVSDAYNCSVEKSFTLDAPTSSLNIATYGKSKLCFGEKGEVRVNAFGGTAPYSYRWSNGSILSAMGGLSAGVFKVSVTDQRGCMLSDSIELKTLSEITFQVNQRNATCNQSKDASISISKIFIGNAPVATDLLKFKWNTNENTNTILNCTPGERYRVTITSSEGCSVSGSYLISQPELLRLELTAKNDEKCFNSADGSARMNAKGGTLPYRFIWDANANNQIGPEATKLAAGKFGVTVLDVNNCKAQGQVIINEAEKININILPTLINCKDAASGKLEAKVSGGLTPYQFIWSTGGKMETANNLKKGSYTITVMDSRSCVGVEKILLEEKEPVKIIAETTDASCADSKDGTIDLYVSGGTSPYVYSLNGKDFNSFSQFSNLKSGWYEIKARDVNGCVVSLKNVLIKAPEPLLLDLGEDLDIAFGDSIRIRYKDQSGLQGGLKYRWETEHEQTISCKDCPYPMIYPLRTTAYTLVLSNANSCSVSDQILVKVHSLPVIAVPTAFSPNGDGVNDYLLILGDSNIKIKQFSVLSRDGAVVFSLGDFFVNDSRMSWDGTTRGKPLPSETYIWEMQVTYPDGRKEMLKGSTNIMR